MRIWSLGRKGVKLRSPLRSRAACLFLVAIEAVPACKSSIQERVATPARIALRVQEKFGWSIPLCYVGFRSSGRIVCASLGTAYAFAPDAGPLMDWVVRTKIDSALHGARGLISEGDVLRDLAKITIIGCDDEGLAFAANPGLIARASMHSNLGLFEIGADKSASAIAKKYCSKPSRTGPNTTSTALSALVGALGDLGLASDDFVDAYGAALSDCESSGGGPGSTAMEGTADGTSPPAPTTSDPTPAPTDTASVPKDPPPPPASSPTDEVAKKLADLINKGAKAIGADSGKLAKDSAGKVEGIDLAFGDNHVIVTGSVGDEGRFGYVRFHFDCMDPESCGAMSCEQQAFVSAWKTVLSRYRYSGCNDNVKPTEDGVCYNILHLNAKDPALSAAIAKKACELRRGVMMPPVDGQITCVVPGARTAGFVEAQNVCADPRAMCAPDSDSGSVVLPLDIIPPHPGGFGSGPGQPAGPRLPH
jgi:hypothetical protein